MADDDSTQRSEGAELLEEFVLDAADEVGIEIHEVTWKDDPALQLSESYTMQVTAAGGATAEIVLHRDAIEDYGGGENRAATESMIRRMLETLTKSKKIVD